jgi:hypothetical protein
MANHEHHTPDRSGDPTLITVPPEPAPDQGPGLVDPRHLDPAPADPAPVAGRPLEVEPLPGPTEASTDTPTPEDADGGLLDPRFLMPGPAGPPAGPPDRAP